MGIDCFGDLENDFTFDCSNPPQSGIEVDVVLIETKKINRTATAVTGNLCTNLEAISGESGIALQGIKRTLTYSITATVREENSNGWVHAANLRIVNMSAESRAEIEKILNSDGITVVVEKKWKGTAGEDAFLILGLEKGMVLSEGVENSEEAEGTFTFTLQTRENELETKGGINLLDTDLATTRTAFGNKFVGA